MEQINGAKVFFKDGNYPTTTVQILDSGWVKLPDKGEWHPPQAIERIERPDQTDG